MGKLDDHVALITGAGSGIGEAIARLFAEEGAKVAIVDINEEAVGKVATSIGENAIPIIADVSKSEDAERMVVETVSAFGSLSILVNNAAAHGLEPVVTHLTPPSEYLRCCVIPHHPTTLKRGTTKQCKEVLFDESR